MTDVLIELVEDTTITVELTGAPPLVAPGAGGSTVDRLATQTLSGHRVVYADSNNSVDYCNPSSYSQCQRIVGITTGAAIAGDTVTVQFQDIITESGWNWTVGGDVYLTGNGQLTQTLPVSGTLVVVGNAVSATSILLKFIVLCQLS